ncbi:MAG: carbon monoxide dehydrogenase subunit G [Alphaproteobacteria bacterium]|nr:carbon monoxide dehydrogenase subunit G [Alphaproteobacteria bacterium]
MDLTGQYRIAAPRQAVWQALNDPEVLRQCIPGCESVEKLSDTEFQARATAAIGPVKARFAGKVTLSDLDPPNGYTISGEGQGGAAGFAKGGAKVRLAEDADATVLTYEVNATVGGKLAQVGSRLIGGVAHKMADEFFGRFAALVAAPAAAAVPVEAAVAPVASPLPTTAPEPTSGAGLPAWAWIAGVIVLAALLLFLFGRG